MGKGHTANGGDGPREPPDGGPGGPGGPPGPPGPPEPPEGGAPATDSSADSAADLRAILDRTTDAVYALDAELRYVHVNDAGDRLSRRLFDVPREELLGEVIWEVYPALEATELYRRCREAMETQEPVAFEEYYPPGESWFDVRCHPSEDGLTAYVRDVTDRKRRERALEQFEAIVDTTADGVYVLDDEYRFTLVNDAYADVVGYEPDELVGEHASTVLNAETFERTDEARREMGDDESVTVEIELLRSDGATVPVEGTLTPFPLTDDRTGTVGVVRDLTERRTLEAEKRAVERDKEAALDRVSDVVWALDAECRYTYLNSGARAIAAQWIGESADDLYGRVLWDAIPETKELGIREAVRRALDSQECVDLVEHLPQVDRWFESQIYPSESGVTIYSRDVTDRKRLESELDDVLDRITDGFYALDREFRVVRWNDEMAARLGVSADELVGEKITEYFHEFRDGDVYPRFVEALSTQEAVTFENYEARWDVWAEITVYPSAAGLSVYSRDVTERKERELELEATRNRLELALTGTENGVWEWNRRTDEVIWDETAECIFGVEPGGFEGTAEAFFERVHPEDADRVAECDWVSSPNAASTPLEHRVLRDDGDERWVECRGRVDDADADRVVGLIRDVTERKERERELERYETIVRTASDGIYAVDGDLRFTLVNDAFAEMTGYDREELLDGDLSLIVEGETLEESFEVRERVLAGEREVGVIADDVLQRDGERLPVEARIAILEADGDYRGSVGVTRDISERLEHERELEARTERLESLVDNGPLVVYALDAVGRFTLSEGAGLDALGLEPGEVVGESVFDVYGDYPGIVDSHRRALAGETVHATHEVDGRVFDNAVRPTVDDGGEVVRVVGVAFDVTERTRYEGALTALHGTARRLSSAGSVEAVFEEVVAAAEEIADLPFTCIYVPDEAAGVLRPTTYTERVTSALEDAPTVPADDSIVGTVYATGTAASFDDIHESPDLFDRSYSARSGVFVPLGGHGVLAAGSTEPGAFDEHTHRLTELLAATAEAALDRIEREREVAEWGERLESVVENAPLAVHTLDAEGRFTLSEGAGLDALGLEPGELVGESVAEQAGDDSRLGALYDRAYDGHPAHAVVERDGVAFENWTRPIFDDDGEVARVIGVALDVTERAQYEGALAALHRSSRDLLNARTGDDVASKVVEASTEVLDLTGVVVYLFDEGENVLRPAAYSPDVPRTVGELATYGPASSITWNVFVTGETASFDDVRESEHVANPDTAVRSGLYIPLGDHGVLAVVSPEHDVLTVETVELIDLFAATAEAALDRVERERAVRDHQWELREQAARLEQLNEINEQLRRVERVLVFETTRDDIERSVCEQLTASDRFAFAWIGEVEDGEVDDGDLSPRAWAGTERGYLDAVSDREEPAARTARTGDVTAVENVADGLRREPWRSEALSRGYQSVVAVPLVYDDLDYGVLTVYATRADAFDAMFRTVFTELGDTIAYAIDSAETKHGLLTDGVVELDLRVPDAADPLAHVARETGGRTTFEGVAPHPDGTRVFFSATGTSAAAVVGAAEESVAVRSIRVISDRDDGGLFELTADGDLLATALTEHGALPREIETEGGRTRLVVELPRTDDVRSFVEMLRTVYPGTELAARRDHDRPIRSRESFGDRLRAELTERQREVLRTAYFSGYFATPRESTGEEVAASLDITQPTFANHLRAGERKLFELLYES